ncbi:MAG: hypothetical protein LBH31_05815 [Burkholderiaceae bacterium]|jgi:hypothetical protein|nr:hypothetical protein [Burkholderiaceae bacterium]
MADDPPKIDVRALSLAQLQHLTLCGSRRAKAELARRMADPHTPASSQKLVTVASIDEMAAPTTTAASATGAAGMTFPGNHDTPPPPPQDAEIARLQTLALQDEAYQRAQEPPVLVGMVLMVWGILMLFGGLVLLTRTGGLYYSLLGLSCLVIGWLLLRSKRIAIWAHAACAVAALLWAWRGYASSNFLSALIQSAPLWIPAFWIAVPPVREPLN